MKPCGIRYIDCTVVSGSARLQKHTDHKDPSITVLVHKMNLAVEIGAIDSVL